GGSHAGLARCSRRGARRRAGTLSPGRSPRPHARSSAYVRWPSSRPGRPRQRSPPARDSWRPTSESGCAGFPASLAFGPTVLPTRWLMTFSRWRAAGNEYLLAERAELGAPLTPKRVQAGVGGSDGILEVVTVCGREAEIVIWNPDGSK